MNYKINPKFLDRTGKIKSMPRDEYDKFVKTLPKRICLICEYRKIQKVIKEWKHWVLLQPVSPYFTYHSMLCSKRHIEYLSQLNNKEREEFWQADKEILRGYRNLGIDRVRTMLRARLKKLVKKSFSNNHLHIHYYKFTPNDFRHLLHKTAYKQDMVKLLGKKLSK